MAGVRIAKALRYLVALALIGLFAWVCRPEQVWAALWTASLPLLATYAALGALAAVFGALALLVLFDFAQQRRWQLRFISDYLYVQGLSQFTPAQLGELALPYVAARQRYAGTDIAAALVIQRVSALLIIVLMALAGAGRWVAPAYLWTASGLVCAACCLVLFVMLKPGRPAQGQGAGARLADFLIASRRMLLGHGDRLAWHGVLMLLRYALSVLANAQLLAAFGIEVPLLDLAAITALAILSNLVPITVGGIGLTEGVFALALKSYGYDTDLTIAAVLAARVVNAALALGWVVLHHGLSRGARQAPEPANTR